jgi:hypothetical protein
LRHLVKEQALKDYDQRRRLTHGGWNYFPFRGTEINQHAKACARLVVKTLEEK